MKERSINIILLKILIVCGVPIYAQTTTKVNLHIDTTYKRNDSVFALIKEGRSMGISVGMRPAGYLSYTKDYDSKYLLDGYVTKVENDQCEVFIPGTFGQLLKYDVFEFYVNIPQRKHFSHFYELAKMGIILYNAQHGPPLYSLSQLIENDTKAIDDTIRSKLKNDIKKWYELLKHLNEQPYSEGRYAGKTFIEVIRDITDADIDNYLLYVSSFASSYRGRQYIFFNGLEGWIDLKAPYSALEVHRDLYPIYKNQKLFNERIKKYRSSIAFLRVAESLTLTAEVHPSIDTAFAHLAFAKALSYAVNDTVGKIYAHFSLGHLYYTEMRYSEANTEYDELHRLLATLNDPNDKNIRLYKTAYTQTIVKKGYSLSKTGREKEAELVLQKAEQEIYANRKWLSDVEYYLALSRRFEYNGYLQHNRKNYDQAIDLYKIAIAYNDSIGSLDSKNTSAHILLYYGELLLKLGKASEAMSAFNRSYDLYVELGQTNNMIKVLDKIATAYYDLAEYPKSIGVYTKAYQLADSVKNNEESGIFHSMIANSYWNMGAYDSAISYHKKALQLRKHSHYGLAYSWKQLGKLYKYTGAKTKALEAFDSSLVHYKFIKDTSGMVTVYGDIGSVYHDDDAYAKAVQFYEQAHKLKPDQPALFYYDYGHAYWELDTAKARKYFMLSESIARKKEDLPILVKSLYALCKLTYNKAKPAQGLYYRDQVMSIVARTDNVLYKAELNTLMAAIHSINNNFDSALYYHNKAFSIYDNASKSSAIWELINIAHVQITMGEFHAAENTFDSAIARAERISSNVYRASAFSAKAFLYGLLGEYNKGMMAIDSAMAIYARTGNVLRMANAYINRSTVLKDAGNFKDAVKDLLFADSIHNKEGTLYYKDVVLNNLGVIYYNQGDYQTALSYFKRSSEYLKKGLVDEFYVLNLMNIAECYYYLHDLTQSEKIMKEIFPIARDNKMNRLATTISLILGKIYIDTDKLKEANIYLQQAKDYSIKSKESERMVDAYVALGRMEAKLGRNEQAENYFREATRLSKEYMVSAQDWLAFYETGLFFYNLKQYDSASVYLKEAANIIERKANYVFGDAKAMDVYKNDPRKQDIYNKLVSSLANINNVSSAITYANRGNQTGLNILSGPPALLSDDKEKDAALQQAIEYEQKKQGLEKAKKDILTSGKEEQSKTKLLAIGKEIRIIEAEQANYLNKLKVKYPDISDYFEHNVNPDDFYNYKGELPDDIAVILYLLNDKELLIFTLTNEELGLHISEIDKRFDNAIIAYKKVIRNPGKAAGAGGIHVRSEVRDEDDIPDVSFDNVSTELYQLLIGSIEDKLKGKTKLCIIPNGSLSNLAFQCLGKKQPDGSFRFLLEQYSIFYSNHLDIFKHSREVKPTPINFQSFSGFGVPDSTLHFNIGEVRNIGKILGSDSSAFTDERATEKKAKSSLLHKKVIHFATHGTLVYYSNFDESFLKLLPDSDTTGGNDGKLRIKEIESLMIKGCDLVTLSACETAVNNEIKKGWNISPANSLLKRKVRSVVASLWKVDDEATSLLMQSLYMNLSTGKGKAESLRLAQIELSKDPRFNHPYFWGAFSLFGEWR